MSYSPVKSMRAVNFRSLGKVDIDMSDCPIIALTGSNESGKTSIIKAFGAVAGNMWRTKQNQYIRTGSDGFAVMLELQDGTKIVRKKTSDFNGYTLVMPDGSRRDATKIDVEVPDYIEAVMGMSRDAETKENLQVRTYEDPLLFVTTTDGQNYKVLHNAISNLDVREATIKAKSDSAELLATATKKREEVEIYNKQLSELPLLDTEYLEVVLASLERAQAVAGVFDTAKASKRLCETLDGSGALKEINKCTESNADAVRVFSEAKRYLDTLRELKKIKTCEGAEVANWQVLSLFENGSRYLSEVREHAAKAVPESVKPAMHKALSLFEQAQESKAVIEEASASIAKLTAGIEKVSVLLKESGMQIVSCDKCGNEIVVPMSA